MVLEYGTKGKHLAYDFWGVGDDLLDNAERLLEILRDGAVSAGATVLKEEHVQFEPTGVTAFLVLSESHVSIHTYPLKGFAAIDVYTCGDHVEPEIAMDIYEQFINPAFVVKHEPIIRGVRPDR